MTTPRRVGVLGGGVPATVDDRGRVRPAGAGWSVDWWIGADDRWHVPSREVAVRQSLLDGMPVVQTALRVPGGDAVARAYGVRTAGDVVVWEVENTSPAPFVVALVVRGAHEAELVGPTLFVDGRPGLRGGRPPSRHAVSNEARGTEPIVTAGAATEGPMPASNDRDGRLEVALLYPVTHRTTLRLELAASRAGLPRPPAGPLADAATVARGWRAQLDRGLRVELPDPQWNATVDRARAAVVLAGQDDVPPPDAVAALEDWGFDAEALAAWRRVRGRQRRALRRRSAVPDWAAVERHRDHDDAAFLLALRRALLVEERNVVRLLPAWPPEWHGAAVDVRGAPISSGLVSFSVRWHGEHPAVLWDAPPGVVLTAPGLDPSWTAASPSGEALLAGRAAAQG